MYQPQSEKYAGERYARETADHEMTVLHEDGIYRHLRFRAPGTCFEWFDIVTWPGHLIINGGMGTWTFARSEDMFDFFRSTRVGGINAGYWSEKLLVGTGSGQAAAEQYDEDTYRREVMRNFTDYLYGMDITAEAAHDLWGAVWSDLLDTHSWDYPGTHAETATEALRRFEHTWVTDPDEGTTRTFRFEDTYEWDLTDYSIFFLWCCFAIRDGIHQYDRSKKPAAVAS